MELSDRSEMKAGRISGINRTYSNKSASMPRPSLTSSVPRPVLMESAENANLTDSSNNDIIYASNKVQSQFINNYFGILSLGWTRSKNSLS